MSPELRHEWHQFRLLSRDSVRRLLDSVLVARDADLFAELARHGAAHVLVSVTTLDPELARRMEPRAARPDRSS